MIKIANRYLFLALFVAFAGLFTLGWCMGASKKKDALNRLEMAQNEILFHKAKIGRDSVFLAQTEQKLVSEREAKKALELTNRDLRAMNIKQANEIDRLKFRIDTLLEDVGHTGHIIHIDTVFVDNIPQNAILLPFSFEKKDKWLDLKGQFDPQGKLDVSLEMDLSVDVITGIDKDKKPTCVLKTDNPYLQMINIASYKTDSQKPKRYGIGLQVGWGLGITENKSVVATPYVGFGIGYNFIRF